MRRRDFIKGIATSATWASTVRAQQSSMPVVGFANGQSPSGFAYLVAAFREGLKQNCYVEGQTVAIEYRWAEGQEHGMASGVRSVRMNELLPTAATNAGGRPLKTSPGLSRWAVANQPKL